MSARRPILGLALAATLAAAGGAGAGELPYGASAYRPVSGGYGGYAGFNEGYGGYGFADEAVRGAYVGAPLTRFPRPSEIVPTPWTYGTYGVPTITGIRRPPVGTPSVTVIDGHDARAARRPRPSARILSRAGDGRWDGMDEGGQPDGVRVVGVRVPRR